MGINLATPHANWKERHEIAAAIGKNTYFFGQKTPISKTETC